MKKQAIWISVILIVILGFAVYGNSLKGEFLWDDLNLIKDNAYVTKWSHAGGLLAGNISAKKGIAKARFYRPIQMLTYTLDYSLWNLEEEGYHLTNILLHVSVALAVFGLVNILFGDMLMAFLTSLFFIIHPIHIEAVSYISGRSDSLSGLFMLLCFIFYLKALHTDKIKFYLLTLLTYAGALLSREASLILIALLGLYHLTFEKKGKYKLFLLLCAASLAYIVLRVTLLKGLLAHDVSTTFSQRLPGFFVAITNYARLLVLPVHLHMEYGTKLFHWGDGKTIAGILILAFILVYAWRERKNKRLVFFSTLWFCIALLPVSNLYPLNAYMAEHWLYIPSIGFFLVLAKGLSCFYRSERFRSVAVIVIISLLSFYSYLTVRQNSYWREPIAFFKRVLKYAPDSARVYNDLGNAYFDVGRNEEAIASYKNAIILNPRYTLAYGNLGILYNDTGQTEEAIAAYKKAISLDPDHDLAYGNLGNIYNDRGEGEEAMALYKKAISLNPDYVEAHSNLGIAYKDMGRTEEAVASYKRAIAINPDYAEAYSHLGSLYRKLGRNEEALALLEKAVSLKPDYAAAYSNFGNVYRNLGKKEEAIASYKKALDLDSDFATAYYNLGNVYRDVDKKEEAIVSYEKAIHIKPEYALAYNNLGVVYGDIGRTEDAITSFKKAISIDPDYVMAYDNLGVAYFGAGRKKEAIDAYKEIIEIDPDFTEAYLKLAWLYYYERQFELAVEYCDLAIAHGHKVSPQLLEMLKPYRK